MFNIKRFTFCKKIWPGSFRSGLVGLRAGEKIKKFVSEHAKNYHYNLTSTTGTLTQRGYTYKGMKQEKQPINLQDRAIVTDRNLPRLHYFFLGIPLTKVVFLYW
jgi:hypothetical protein